MIGGGLAGLSAAVRLCDEGWKVKVLEKEDRVGGRCKTARHGDFLFDTGAQHFHDSYDDTLSTAIRNGLGGSFRIPQESKGIFHGDRVTQFTPRDLNPMALLPWKAMGAAGLWNTLSVGAKLAHNYRRYNLRFPFWWSRGDGMSASDFLDGRSTSSYRSDIAEPVALYATGALLDELSAAGLMVALRYTFFDRTGGFTEGMGALPEALAVKPEVVTGMEALEVVRDGKRGVGVRARPSSGGRARTYRADAIICAIPAPQVESVTGKLGDTAHRVIAETTYNSSAVVNLALAGQRQPGGPVLLPLSEGFNSSWICSAASKAAEYAPEGASVVTAVFCGRSARRLVADPDTAAVEQARADAARVYGTDRSELLDSRVDRHAQAFPVVSQGHSSRVRALRQDGSGIENVILAGDWTMSPTVEGAIASGMWAAGLALASDALSQ